MGTGPNFGGVITFSQTAAQNATADSTQAWNEGQSPGSLNDLARGLLASIAKYRDDIAGSIVTGGSSTAYSISSSQQFANASYLAGQVIAFSPHVTNGAGPVTLTLDGAATNWPLRTAPNTEMLAGTLIAGTPYLCTFSATDNAFYLQSFYGSPYLIPVGGLLDFIVSTPPNAQFAIPNGQLLSRTVYATLFALIGTTYSAGDGVSNFGIPDFRGRVLAMMEATPTLLTSTFFGGNSSVIGATGGAQSEALSATNQLPRFTPSGSVSAPTINAGGGAASGAVTGSGTQNAQAGSGAPPYIGSGSFGPLAASAPAFTGNAIGATSPTAFATVPPTAIVQRFLRVI